MNMKCSTFSSLLFELILGPGLHVFFNTLRYSSVRGSRLVLIRYKSQGYSSNTLEGTSQLRSCCITEGTKGFLEGCTHWLLFYFSHLFIVIRTLQLFNPHCPSTFPSNTVSSVKHDCPYMADGERERCTEKKRKKKTSKRPSHLSFPLFGYAALPCFHSSGKLHFFPLRSPSTPQSKAL